MSPASRARVLTCPRCKEVYWAGAGEQLPDCPHCRYDYRRPQGFRFDLLFLMVLIIAMLGFLLLTANYKSDIGGSMPPRATQGTLPEKLPGR